jgi:hypothetical protein
MAYITILHIRRVFWVSGSIDDQHVVDRSLARLEGGRRLIILANTIAPHRLEFVHSSGQPTAVEDHFVEFYSRKATPHTVADQKVTHRCQA